MKRMAAIALLALAFVGCRRHRMSAQECSLVLDRIVELELSERGFRDPVLAKRRQSQLRSSLAPELDACEGRRVKREVASCVKAAKSAEEISHVCLR